jgi:hypothetical protein
MMRRHVLVAAALVVVAGVAFSTCGPPPVDACVGRKAGDLVITELMIDPDGTDTGAEWIEVFNSLGTPLDLKGLSLYVKDVDGTNLKTHVIRSGTVTAGGLFVMGDVRSGPNPAWVNYSYADALGSMGNTRGVVGVRCGTTVLDEVSYTMTAKPARSRMLSGGTITPSATANDDEANWCDADPTLIFSTPNAGTPGAANPICKPVAMAGTCLENGVARAIVSPTEGQLVITELMPNPAVVSDTAGEWLEVLARADVDLNGLTMFDASNSKSTVTSADCVHVTSGTYVLLARNVDPAVNGGLPPVTAAETLSLNAAGERVSLFIGDAGIDSASVGAASSGKSWQLDPTKLDPLSNDDPANFCKAPLQFSPDGGDFGSPGAANPSCAAMPDAGDPNNCFDTTTMATRPVNRPGDGDLVISEWMADPSVVADTAGEWFEVLVNRAVDLNGLVLGDSSTVTTTLANANCLAVNANSYVVFAKNASAAANGNLPAPLATFAFDLNNTNDSIRVLNVDGGVLDSVSYATARAGSSTQLKPGLTSPADNDVATNLCNTPDAGANRYGPVLADGGVSGDLGTPGLVNVACP